MAHLTSSSYPPHHHHGPAKPIPASAVLPLIQNYLTQSTTSAHLHPDCLFIEREGPTFSSNSRIGGVVMHQLRRVEAGLRGIWLGVVDDDILGVDAVGAEEAEQQAQNEVDGDDIGKSNDERLDGQIDEYETHLQHRPDPGVGTAEELGNYQEQLRDQGKRTEWGEIGDRMNAVRNRVRAPEVQSTSTGAAKKRKQDQTRAQHATGDKTEARKKAKKERQREEKARRADERMAKRKHDGDGDEDEREEETVEAPKPSKSTKNGTDEAPKSKGVAEKTPTVHDDERAKAKARKHARKERGQTTK